MLGASLPNWLVNPRTVLLRRHVRKKDDPSCDEVDLIDANCGSPLLKKKTTTHIKARGR